MQYNKALIAAAVTAGLAASASAMAEVTVYGKIHTSVGLVSSDTCTATVTTNCDLSSTQIKSNASRIGIKSDKGLENGMTIKGQAEFEVDYVGDASKSSKDLIKLRNTFIGLKGGFGEVRVGMHDTPHKMSTKKLDPFADTYGDYNNIITHDKRLGNVFAYLNKFGPVGFAAAAYAGDDSVTGENAQDATSIMVNYSGGPLYLAGAVEQLNGINGPGTLDSATKFGAGYNVGPVELGLVYEILAYEGDTKKDETETYVSAQFKVANNMKLKAAYGMRDDDVSTTDDEVMSVVGLDYKLDKSAKIYALYANGTDGGLAHKAKLNGDGTALAMGLVYKF